MSMPVFLCLFCSLATLFMCLNAQVIGKITHLIDRPDGCRKHHSVETPLIGGLAVMLPALLVAAIYFNRIQPVPHSMIVLTWAAAAALILGTLDDMLNLSARMRLLFFSAITFAVLMVYPSFVLHAIHILIFNHTVLVGLGIVAAPVIALVIIGFINAVNMADGLNGQLLGSIMIWSGFLLYYFGWKLGLPYFALMCSALVAFVFNLPGRLFMGSAGAYAAAMFIGLSAIVAYRHMGRGTTVNIPLSWFWLPVLDCVRLMISRTISRKSIFSPDRNHLHHKLGQYIAPPQTLLVYLIFLAAPGLAAIANPGFGQIVLVLCTSCYLLFILWYRIQREKLEVESSASSISIIQQ
jgi:UDP-GlcNAc:undecaprenyl-phosphate GlcNAc-1-phosphate transferase